jgi:plasmid stabilization system protein ParE
MSAKHVQYHQGASADLKNAVAWYRQRSSKAALDFIEELRRATETIRESPDRWPIWRDNTRRFLL